MIIYKGTHCWNGHVCCCFVYMATMRHHMILIIFKNMTCHFNKNSVVSVVTFVFRFLRVTIALC